MRIKLPYKKKNDDGFTLIELMITMLVMGILAGITAFGLAQFQQQAKDSCTAAADKILASAQRAWVAAEPGTRTLAAAPDEAGMVAAGYLEEVRDCG